MKSRAEEAGERTEKLIGILAIAHLSKRTNGLLYCVRVCFWDTYPALCEAKINDLSVIDFQLVGQRRNCGVDLH